jgi:riboflavin kinase
VTSLHGVVTSGLGQGAQFMGLPWVRDVIRRMTGFDPYPGTFNVRLVDPSMVAVWRRIRQGPGLRVDPPAAEQCGARLIAVVVAPDVAAAVIVPDVTRHGDDVLEVVAGVHVRRLLGLRDDDPVTLRVPETTAW